MFISSHSKQIQSSPGRTTQGGAALVTAMVFVAVLAIIGVSSMKNTRVDQQMATNIQKVDHAFQYGESGLAPGLGSGTLFSTRTRSIDFTAPDQWLCHQSGDVQIPVSCAASSNTGNAAIVTSYRGQGKLPPKNFSLDSGFSTHYFFVASQGRNDDVVSNHEIGISLVGPADLTE